MSDTSNVVEFTGITQLHVPAERILEQAKKAELGSVVIIGEDADGEFYFASSIPDGPNVLWLLALAQRRLLDVVED